jgi:hypothetical protein
MILARFDLFKVDFRRYFGGNFCGNLTQFLAAGLRKVEFHGYGRCCIHRRAEASGIEPKRSWLLLHSSSS